MTKKAAQYGVGLGVTIKSWPLLAIQNDVSWWSLELNLKPWSVSKNRANLLNFVANSCCSCFQVRTSLRGSSRVRLKPKHRQTSRLRKTKCCKKKVLLAFCRSATQVENVSVTLVNIS